MIKAVIFDLDDTLISENEYIKSGYRNVAKNIVEMYNLNCEQKEIYNLLINNFANNPKNVFNITLEQLNIDYNENDIMNLVKIYRNHKPDISYYSDVLNFIEKIKKNNLKLGIITDGYLETQEAKIEQIDAYSMFDYIILTEKLGREFWKPHPKAFEIIKGKFGVQYDEIVYIGDNPNKDFYIKKYYPIKTIRIIRNDSIYKYAKYYENIGPDMIVSNLNEIQFDKLY